MLQYFWCQTTSTKCVATKEPKVTLDLIKHLQCSFLLSWCVFLLYGCAPLTREPVNEVKPPSYFQQATKVGVHHYLNVTKYPPNLVVYFRPHHIGLETNQRPISNFQSLEKNVYFLTDWWVIVGSCYIVKEVDATALKTSLWLLRSPANCFEFTS